MADVRPPNEVEYDYGQFKAVPGTSGTAGPNDTFFGERNKVYIDYLARQLTRVRGTNAYYYVLADQSRRLDGDTPLSSAEDGGRINFPETAPSQAFLRKRHAGQALYGEYAVVKRRLDSVRREVQPDWPYKDPILVRVVLGTPEFEREPDERGTIYVRRLECWIARVLCEREWDFQPHENDIMRFPKLLDQYMDIEEVSRDDEQRYGANGFFQSYKLRLVKSSKYEPQRKIAETKLTNEPPPTGGVDETAAGPRLP